MELKNKRGLFFSVDALIAMSLIFIFLLITFPQNAEKRHESDITYDIIDVLSNLKVGQINNTYVKNLIANNTIENLNNSLLEQIGDFYSKDETLAKEFANNLLSEIPLKENIGIWYGEDLIGSKNTSSYESSKDRFVTRQIISGIGKNSPSKGYVAKAWLKKIEEKTTTKIIRGELTCGRWTVYSWGQYCGSAETIINNTFVIPQNATIVEAYWLAEPSWTGQQVSLWVNGVTVYNAVIPYFVKVNITNRIQKGENIVRFRGTTGGDDGASHIVIKYKTPDLQTYDDDNKHYFSEVRTTGILNNEKSILISESIESIKVSLNTTSRTTLLFRKGATTITIGTKDSSSGKVEFSNSEISSALTANGLSYSDLKNEYFAFITRVGVNQQGQIVTLRENSYVEIETSSHVEIPFGSIDITQTIPIVSTQNNLQNSFYRNLKWEFILPNSSIPIKTDWQLGWLSTGTGSTTQIVRANNITLYNSPPNPYIPALNRYGYSPSKSGGLFINGKNNFTLQFGDSYGVSSESSQGSVTYFIKSFVNYGSTLDKAQGGRFTVVFIDGSQEDFIVGNSTDPWDPEKDAIDDAIQRLLSQMTSPEGRLEIGITQEDFEISILDIAGVPYLWNTEVQIRAWQ